MALSHKIFNSKLLLFGEHIINKGAKGLAVPIEHYSGHFQFGEMRIRAVRESNQALQSFANYIIHTELSAKYDTNQFLDDIDNGLHFNSNIFQGYGLGSSGALVAAVYNQYRLLKKKKYVVTDLKNELALLESYFHGKSSGLDAIVCYMNKAVLLDNNEVSEAFDLPKSENPAIKVFVINTHVERSTAPFVNLFLEKCKDAKFMSVVEKSLVPATNMAIESFLDRKYDTLMSSVKLISQLQYDMLPEFIPSQFREVWQESLKSNQFHLKLCGAGGGGFIIGFAPIDAKLDLLLAGKDVLELIEI